MDNSTNDRIFLPNSEPSDNILHHPDENQTSMSSPQSIIVTQDPAKSNK